MPRNFPHWIKAYVDHAKHTEAPTIYHVWTAVSTIAGALRRQVWIDEVEFKFYPNFYIFLVGPAAITKTTAIVRGMDMLRHVDGVHFGPRSATWQKFIEIMKEAEQDFTVVLPDGTSKSQTSSPLTVAASEVGTFFKLDDAVMVDVLTDLWDSPDPPGGWRHSTISSGDNVVFAPCLNFIGGVTPPWIRQNFSEHLIGTGLSSRIIFVFAEEKANLVAYPSRMIKEEEQYRKQKLLIEDLQRIGKLKGRFVLTDEAYDWGTKWYERFNKERPAHMLSDRFNSYLGRRQVYMHKLAMVLAAAKRDKLVIEAEDLKESLTLIELAEPMMMKVFETIGMVDEAQQRKTLIHHVRVHKVLTSNQLWSQVSNIMKQREFSDILRGLVQEGIFKLVQRPGQSPAVTLSAEARKELAKDG